MILIVVCLIITIFLVLLGLAHSPWMSMIEHNKEILTFVTEVAQQQTRCYDLLIEIVEYYQTHSLEHIMGPFRDTWLNHLEYLSEIETFNPSVISIFTRPLEDVRHQLPYRNYISEMTSIEHDLTKVISEMKEHVRSTMELHQTMEQSVTLV